MAFLFPITPPVKQWYDLAGAPLQSGYIYCGAANQNPETVATTMYWDAAGLIPAAQPLRTINGYIVRAGTPANLYASGDFSITVKDKTGRLVFTSPTSVDLQLALAITGAGTAAAIPLADAGTFFTTDNVEAAFQQMGPLIAQMVTALAGTVPTGSVTDWVGTDVGPHAVPAPAGWLYVSGKTIGNATSGATAVGGASAASSDLFNLLWNSYSNTELPIQDLSGALVARGASASNDFTASRRLPLPDCRGRVRAGRGDMGTVDAGRLTAAGLGAGQSGIAMGAASTGATGFTQTHALTSGELAAHTHTFTGAAHTHTVTDPGHTHTVNGAAQTILSPNSGAPAAVTTSVSTASSTTGVTNQNTTATGTNSSTGSNTAFSVVQPTIIFSTIIKL